MTDEFIQKLMDLFEYDSSGKIPKYYDTYAEYFMEIWLEEEKDLCYFTEDMYGIKKDEGYLGTELFDFLDEDATAVFSANKIHNNHALNTLDELGFDADDRVLVGGTQMC